MIHGLSREKVESEEKGCGGGGWEVQTISISGTGPDDKTPPSPATPIMYACMSPLRLATIFLQNAASQLSSGTPVRVREGQSHVPVIAAALVHHGDSTSAHALHTALPRSHPAPIISASLPRLHSPTRIIQIFPLAAFWSFHGSSDLMHKSRCLAVGVGGEWVRCVETQSALFSSGLFFLPRQPSPISGGS